VNKSARIRVFLSVSVVDLFGALHGFNRGDLMTRRFATCAIVLLAASGMSAGAYAQESGVQRSFGGDTVHLDLSAGNYRVTASPDDRIRVKPLTKTDRVSVRLNENLLGTRATVRVVGPKDGFDADIQLPARVSVVVELAGGSLQLSGVQGSKDIAANTAQIEIAVGRREDYRQVTASVTAGELTASAFDAKASGVRSFEWTGNGPYDLRVRLEKGRVTLKN
jgi:hypothetical protein